MFQKKYAAAKPLLDELIASGNTSDGLKYGLTDEMKATLILLKIIKVILRLFLPYNMAVNDGSGNAQNANQGVANGNYGDVLNFPYSAGPGACCGFFNPSQSLANAYKTNANGLPLLDESYNTGANVII